MRFMSISFKIKLCWKKNFLLQNYLIYDLQAGTKVRQNWGQGTSDPFYCIEQLKWRVLRDDFRKVQGTTQHYLKRNSWFVFWCYLLFFININQPVTDPHRPQQQLLPGVVSNPFRRFPLIMGSREELQRMYLFQTFAWRLCWWEEWKGCGMSLCTMKSPSSWTPDPHGCAQVWA